MRQAEKMSRIDLEDCDSDRDVCLAGSEKDSSNLGDALHSAERSVGPFFMDFDDGLADDPANYCLPAEARFPD